MRLTLTGFSRPSHRSSSSSSSAFLADFRTKASAVKLPKVTIVTVFVTIGYWIVVSFQYTA